MLDFDGLDGAPPFGRFAAGLGLAALHEAQRRNVRALLSANRTAVAGYQDLFCARLVERCAARVAETRDRMEALQVRPLDAGSPARHIAEAGAAFARGLADLRGLSEMAEGTTADAVAILRQRTEEALSELRAGMYGGMHSGMRTGGRRERCGEI